MTDALLLADEQLNRDNYYEASVQRPSLRPCLQQDLRIDVAIVGGGLAGLNAAIELALRGDRVAVFEANRVGSGASGRNGGQALVGFACGQLELERQLGRADALRAWEMSIAAVQLLKQRMLDSRVDAHWQAGALTVARGVRKRKALAEEFDLLQRLGGVDAQWLQGDALSAHINSEAYSAGIHESTSGHLHPLKYTLGLADYAQRLGVQIFERSVVTGLQDGSPVVLELGPHRVKADVVVLAGNCSLPLWSKGLASSIHPRIMPVGTYMIATQELSDQQASKLMPTRAAVCDNNFVLDYYRLSADNRMLFGGRVSYSTRTPPNLAGKMRQRMLSIFPSLGDAKVDHVWGGFVDISMNRAPDFGVFTPRVYYLQGFSGHGLALTGLAGQVVTEAIHGQSARWQLFARLRHRRFPGGLRWRTPILAAGMAFYRLRDWFD